MYKNKKLNKIYKKYIIYIYNPKKNKIQINIYIYNKKKKI